ncbi:MAG: sigma-70 family RNA polymerase sigma factor [Sedimentisphaerales bacterium]|nr:sigma-70 family RNA polymerase sigma factor [Sedimentisphaerales bacterium]
MASRSNVSHDNVNEAARIFEEHGEYIHRIINFQVNNKSLADDIYQEFFLSLIRKPVPSDVENIRSYLYRAIYNDVMDVDRRSKRYQERIKGYADFREQITDDEDVTKNLSAREEIEKMFEIVDKYVSRIEAKAIHLRYGENNNIQEVAKKMGVKTRSVSRYLSLGTKKIRQALSVQGVKEGD